MWGVQAFLGLDSTLSSPVPCCTVGGHKGGVSVPVGDSGVKEKTVYIAGPKLMGTQFWNLCPEMPST